MSKRRSVKQNNRKTIMDYIRNIGEFSISDVSAKTGISKTTVKKVLDFYQEQGFVQVSGKGGSSDEGGKKPLLFNFNKDNGFVISVHIGPGFIKAILTDISGNTVYAIHTDAVRPTAGKAAVQVAGIINDILDLNIVDSSLILACVLAIPGVVNPHKGLSVYSPHYESWGSNAPFLSMVKESVSLKVPFYFDNVNRFQAFAEKALGSARDINNFLIIDAIAEGVGAGVVLNGTIRHGGHNLSGEIGHMVLSPDADQNCICGGKGCFETMVSLRRIKQLAAEREPAHPGSLIYRNGQNFELEDLFAAADERDALAVSILEDIAFWFALGLNNIVMINDPHLIIIQGMYTAAGDWFLERIKSEMQNLTYPGIRRNIDIVYSRLGPDRGVLGGAVYAIWDYFETSSIYGNIP